MSKLWIFGDSYSANFKKSDIDDSKLAKYCEWKGYEPKVYGQIVSEYFNLDINNKAVHGSDNACIFQSFCDSSEFIEDGDFLIFGWSHCDRFRIANTKKNEWITINSHYKNGYEKFISENTCIEILHNRMNILYMEEVNSWIKLIRNRFNKNTIINWHWSKNQKTYSFCFDTFETITEDTNEKIIDPHYSENGQIQLANAIIEKIEKKEIIKFTEIKNNLWNSNTKKLL